MSLGNEIRKKIKELTGHRNLNNVFLENKLSMKKKLIMVISCVTFGWLHKYASKVK